MTTVATTMISDDFSRNGAFVILIRIIGAGLALLAQIVASRVIGADEFGRYSLILVWLLLLGHGGTLGTNPLICRYVAQYLKAGDLPAVVGLLRCTLLVVVTAGAVIGFAAIGILHAGWLGIDAHIAAIGTVAFCAVPLLILQDFLESVARGLDRPTLGIGPTYLVRHLGILAGIGCVLLLGVDADGLTVMAFTVAGLVVSLAIQTGLLWRYLRPLREVHTPTYQISEWFRTALPMALGDAAEVLFMNADIMILGMFVTPDQVAYYFAATRLAQILAYIPYGMSAATAQRMAVLAEAHERGPLQRLVARTTFATGSLTLLGAVTMAFLAAPLLSMFGSDYSAASHVVAILCGGLTLACLLGPGEDVLNMLGQERAASLSVGAALIVNIGLNFALIPTFGPVGAATASASALALRGTLMAIFAYRTLGLLLPLGFGWLAKSRRKCHA